jgi:hypothetical protein
MQSLPSPALSTTPAVSTGRQQSESFATRDLNIPYEEERHDLTGYTDADGASHEHCHAISGYAVLLGGGTISWQSRKQDIVTLSTAEAEYSQFP